MTKPDDLSKADLRRMAADAAEAGDEDTLAWVRALYKRRMLKKEESRNPLETQ